MLLEIAWGFTAVVFALYAVITFVDIFRDEQDYSG